MILLSMTLALAMSQGPDITSLSAAQLIDFASKEQDPAKKLEYALIALHRSKVSGDKELQAGAYLNIGSAYSRLGDRKRAKSCYEDALGLTRVPERRAQALNNLSIVCNESGDFDGSRRYIKLGLETLESISPPTNAIQRSIGRLYGQLGRAYQETQRYPEALSAFERSLGYRYQFDSAERQAGTLLNVANVLDSMGRTKSAFDRYVLSWTATAGLLEQQVKAHQSQSLELAADVLASLGSLVGRTNADAGIVLLKESVNYVQQERRQLESLPADLRQSFVATKSEPFLELARLLTQQGRLGEAERVLDLLKDQESADYFRTAESGLAIVAQLAKEADDWLIWSKIPDEMGAQLLEFDQLRSKLTKTPADLQREEELRPLLAQALRSLNEFYATLQQRPTQALAPKPAPENLSDLQRAVSDLERQTGKPTAAVRIFQVSNELITFLVSPDGPMAFRTRIPDVAWNEAVGSFANALRNPRIDCTESSRTVYDLTIGKVRKELERRRVVQLVCALHGPLRYIPVAALWDGSQYMADRFDIAYFVSGTQVRPSSGDAWTVAAFAVDKSVLPGASEEADAIVRTPSESSGIFPGEQFLGKEFTPESLFRTLDLRNDRVLHLATHFILNPTVDDSYLESGDGSPIPISALLNRAAGRQLFQDVDLLYLSACSTAEIAPERALSGDGREVDTAAAFALRNAARTVVASLWRLDDRSGSKIAQAFYTRRKEHPNESLAGLLRQAQVSVRDAGPFAEQSVPRSDPTSAPPMASGKPFKLDPSHPYAHPYFWAGVVMYGSTH